LSFTPAPDHGGIAAAAGGAFALKVERPADLEGAIASALAAVNKEGRAAVLDVKVTPA
jgi:acetolactate synthase-1/2/3 large subunit